MKNIFFAVITILVFSCNNGENPKPNVPNLEEGECILTGISYNDTTAFKYNYDKGKLISIERNIDGKLENSIYTYNSSGDLVKYSNPYGEYRIETKDGKIISSMPYQTNTDFYSKTFYTYDSEGKLILSLHKQHDPSQEDTVTFESEYYYVSGNVSKEVGTWRTVVSGKEHISSFEIYYYYDSKKNYLAQFKNTYPVVVDHYNQNNIIKREGKNIELEDTGTIIYEYNEQGYPIGYNDKPGIEFIYDCN